MLSDGRMRYYKKKPNPTAVAKATKKFGVTKALDASCKGFVRLQDVGELRCTIFGHESADEEGDAESEEEEKIPKGGMDARATANASTVAATTRRPLTCVPTGMDATGRSRDCSYVWADYIPDSAQHAIAITTPGRTWVFSTGIGARPAGEADDAEVASAESWLNAIEQAVLWAQAEEYDRQARREGRPTRAEAAAAAREAAKLERYVVSAAHAEMFTAEELLAYKRQFGNFDADGGGSVCEDELGAMMRKMGSTVSDEQLTELIAEVDEDGNGEMDFDEFLTMVENYKCHREGRPTRREAAKAAEEARKVASYVVSAKHAAMFEAEELMRYKKQFALLDADGGGSIGEDKLGAMMAKLDITVSAQMLTELIAEVDEDGNGEMDFTEFLAMMDKMKTRQRASTQDAMRAAAEAAQLASYVVSDADAERFGFDADEILGYKRMFATFDADGGGSIDEEELIAAFAKMGEHLSWEQVGELIAAVDEDGNGEIDFTEFLAMMDKMRHGTLESDRLVAVVSSAKAVVAEEDMARKLSAGGMHMVAMKAAELAAAEDAKAEAAKRKLSSGGSSTRCMMAVVMKADAHAEDAAAAAAAAEDTAEVEDDDVLISCAMLLRIGMIKKYKLKFVELYRNGSIVWYDRRNGVVQGSIAFARPRRLGASVLPSPLSASARARVAEKLVCGALETTGTDFTLSTVPFAPDGSARIVSADAAQMDVRTETHAARDDWLLALRCLSTCDDSVNRPDAPAGAGGTTSGVTPLMLAAAGGLGGEGTLADMLYEILEAHTVTDPANWLVDAVDAEGRSALIYAAAAGKLSMLQRLLDAGAKSDTACKAVSGYVADGESHGGWTALHFAVHAGAIDCVMALTKAANLRPATTPAKAARPPAAGGSASQSKKRVSILPPTPHGSELDARTDEDGLTAAMLAAQRGDSGEHLVCLRVLAAAGADLTLRSVSGQTALQLAEQQDTGAATKRPSALVRKQKEGGSEGLSMAEFLQYEKRHLDGANAFVGARVVRGPDYLDAGGGIEDGEGGEGTIIGCVPPEGDARGPSGDAPRFAEMCRVAWDTGKNGDYKIGRRGKFQLAYADGFDATKKRPRQSVVFGEGAKLQALEEAAEQRELLSESSETRAKYAQAQKDKDAEQPAFDDDELEGESEAEEEAKEEEDQKAAAKEEAATKQEARDEKARQALALAERRRKAKSDPTLAAMLEAEDAAKDAARAERLGKSPAAAAAAVEGGGEEALLPPPMEAVPPPPPPMEDGLPPPPPPPPS